MFLKHVVDQNEENTLAISDDIAIVGSSPRLANKPVGSIIDQHDTVIRCNAQPIKPHITGYKTSIRMVNDSNYDKFIESNNSYNVIGFGLHAYHPPRRKSWLGKDGIYSFDHEKGDSIWANKVLESIGLTPRFNEGILKYIHEKDWPPIGLPYRVHPRMGLRATLIAVDSGVKPTLYGFDDVLAEKYKHFWGSGHSHGFGWEQINEMGHQVEVEMRIIKELRDKDLITWI